VNAKLPPLVVPFRGERYAPTNVSPVLAPPYDVIASEDRRRYAARDPHNIVHLILPEAPEGEDRYARAAALLQAWRRDGVLRRDPADAVYVVAQGFALPTGERRTRLGMFAGVAAEPFAAGRVRPGVSDGSLIAVVAVGDVEGRAARQRRELLCGGVRHHPQPDVHAIQLGAHVRWGRGHAAERLLERTVGVRRE